MPKERYDQSRTSAPKRAQTTPSKNAGEMKLDSWFEPAVFGNHRRRAGTLLANAISRSIMPDTKTYYNVYYHEARCQADGV